MLNIETILQFQQRRGVRDQAIFYDNEVFTYFDEGLTRYVFVNEDKTRVVKILIDANSKDFNLDEVKRYENASEEVRKEMAETKLVLDGLLVEQEFCNPIKFDDRPLTIKQIQFASSCRDEVGWNKDGELVCFDLDEYKKY